MPLSSRPTYSLSSLETYLSHISLPAPQTQTLLQNVASKSPVSSGVPVNSRDWASSSSALETLQELQKYQQAKIPFSNLYLHYSRHHVGTMDPRGLFEYMVLSKGIATEGEFQDGILGDEDVSIAFDGEGDERSKKWEGRPASGGRGGTCTMNNTFFGTVMRSFGMDVMCSGARVALSVMGGARGLFGGWNHQINIVTFEGRKYLVDVGFGGHGPTSPVELQDGNEVNWGSTKDRVRLIYSSIPEFSSPSSRCWILQYRSEGDSHWADQYCFTETEFLSQDIAVMDFKTTGDLRGSFFNHLVICWKNLMDENGELVGTLKLTGGKLEMRVDGVETVLADFKSEVERWEILEREFGIILGDEERKGIQGLVTQLRGKPKSG